MIKLKVSYTEDKELAGLTALLSTVIKNCKKSNNDKGSYKKAYIELKELDNVADK